jgi:hypothetical protein
MKAVDFYKLPRSIQDRFVGSVMSGFPPAPLLATKGGTKIRLLWLGLTAVCLVGLVVTTRLGYGSLDSALSLHTWKALPLYLALCFGVAFGLLQAFARLVRERALPYAAGVYLFPACLIDARSEAFKIYDTKDLASADLRGASLRVGFAGGASFLFPLRDAGMGQALVAEVHAARDRAMHAHATEDPAELVAVDPLHNPRFSSPVGPREPYSLRLPPWGKLGAAVAGVVCIAFGPTIWALRNKGSDKTMYARATQANDALAYRQYLTRGDRYKQEVSDVLLPRAELKDAIRIGTVDALLAYKEAHPHTKIGEEVSVAIRTAMLAELEKAKAVGTLAALDDFAKRYPEHGVDPELHEAIHAIYAREFEAYKKRAPNKDKEHQVLALVERLFGWAEKHGPRIEVRFRRMKSDTLTRADQFVLKTPTFAGVASYPTRYFDDAHAQKREEALGKTLTTKLDAGISPELFDVVKGADVPTDADLPEVKVPTLFVTHTPVWTGMSYVAQKPRGSYIGVNYEFEVLFTVPGDAKPYKHKTAIFKHAMLSVLKEGDEPPPPGTAEERVYEAMSTSAFDTFADRILSLFFKDG